jgi:hypothetical protein
VLNDPLLYSPAVEQCTKTKINLISADSTLSETEEIDEIEQLIEIVMINSFR